MRRHTLTKRTLPAVFVLLMVGGLLVAVPPAEAGQVGPAAGACLNPAFGGSTNCTANDVVIATAVPLEVDGVACGGTGQDPCTCAEGSDIDVLVRVTYQLSGGGTNQTRYDLGSFFNTGADKSGGGRTGICIHATIQPDDDGFHDAPVSSNPLVLDGDKCGDIDAGVSPLETKILLEDVECRKVGGTGPNKDKVHLPYCLAWKQPGSNTVCEEPTISTAGIVDTDAIPGTKSKCKCDDNFFIDVTVVPPQTSGHKCAVETTNVCATVRYEVAITGSLPTGSSDTSVQVNSPILDNKFGNVGAVHAANTNCGTGVSTCGEVTGTTCAQPISGGAGTLSGQAGAGPLPFNLGTGGTYTCHFDGVVCQAPGTHTNKVEAEIQSNPSGQKSAFSASTTITVRGVTGDACPD